MVTSTTLKHDTAPHIQPQILQNTRVSNMSLHSIILECSQTGKRVINSDLDFKKTKYVPIAEDIIAQIYPKKCCKDLKNLGSVKGARKVELIRFKILKETKEVTDIERDSNNYILLKAKNFKPSSEDEMSREIYFLNKYANKPGILPIIAQYSYISRSRTREICETPKKAIITRRLQDLSILLEGPKHQAKLSSSIQQLDLFKKEAKKQLLEAVLTVHNQGDVHRDLKPQNTLWEKVDDSLKFYLIDFGMSLDYEESGNVKNLAGTYRYCDPQILNACLEGSECRDETKRHEIRNKATNQKNDIFSLGLMFYLFREGTHQLPDSIQILMDDQNMFPVNRVDLVNLPLVPFFRSLTQDQHLFKIGSFEHLVWRMLRPNPEERITAQEAFEELTRINNETK